MPRAAKFSFPAGLTLLAAVWIGPLPDLAGRSFAAHMALHMSLVAVAAPLLAFGLGARFAGSRLGFLLAAPLLAALVEFVVMWGWHLPALHGMARATWYGLAAEQVSFLAAGVLMWTAALSPGRAGALAGAGGLLLTSMHVTLLGALLTLSPRLLYTHAGGFGLAPLEDQALGGMIMLAVGTPVYLIAGLLLMAKVLREDGSAEGPAMRWSSK